MPSNFLIKNAKFILLTYARANNVDPYNVLSRICSVGAECIIAREQHADGGVHLHVLCEWQQPFSSRQTTIFDVDGKHPNIEKVGRTPWLAYDYATKDGDIILGGLARPDSDSSTENSRRCWEGEYTSKWAYIVAATDSAEFWSRLTAEDPRSLACNYTSIAKYAHWRYEPKAEEYSHPCDFSFNMERYPQLVDWIDTSMCQQCERDRYPPPNPRSGCGL